MISLPGMTEIRVNSPPMEDGEESQGPTRPHLQSTSTSIQLKGLVADNPDVPVATPNSTLERSHAGKRQLDNLTEAEKRERANSRHSIPASLKSEPDLDTIMPLPGTYMLSRAAGGVGNGRKGSLLGGGEDYQDHHSQGSEDGRENSYSPSFTTVEVGVNQSMPAFFQPPISQLFFFSLVFTYPAIRRKYILLIHFVCGGVCGCRG